MPRKAQPAFETEKDVFSTRLRSLMDIPPKTSQEELAKAIGVTRQAVSNYKSGQSSPDWKGIVKIANYFNVSTDYLLGVCDTKSTDIQVKTVCKYTSLSENAIESLHKFPLLGEVYGTIIEECGFTLGVSIAQMCEINNSAVLKHEKMSADLKNKVSTFQVCASEYAVIVRNLELAIYRVEKICRSIPGFFGAPKTLNKINSFILNAAELGKSKYGVSDYLIGYDAGCMCEDNTKSVEEDIVGYLSSRTISAVKNSREAFNGKHKTD